MKITNQTKTPEEMYNELISITGYGKNTYSGKKGRNSKSGKKETKFNRAEFCAWDGEGIDKDSFIHNGQEYTNQDYVLLANSFQKPLCYSDMRALSTRECLIYMIDTAIKFPKAIHVAFSFNYDVNMILKDLPKENLQELLSTGKHDFTHHKTFWKEFRIEWIPSKFFRVTMKYPKINGKRKPNVTITIFDTFGFFQNRFTNAIKDWLGDTIEEYSLIEQGKALRDHFTDVSLNFLIEYNKAEIDVLVQIMEKLHHSVNSMGLVLKEWHGAGAIATAMFKKHNCNQYIPDDSNYDPALTLALRHSQAGGRIECLRIGDYSGRLYGNDVRSAYPYIISKLPDLNAGHWKHIINPDIQTLPQFSVVRVQWDFTKSKAVFHPFFYRTSAGHILFPAMGQNWIWMPEIDSYLDCGVQETDNVIYHEAWVYYPDDPTFFPFSWVNDYFEERKKIKNGTSELAYGAHYIIKLGLNSMYGKFAQNVGYNPIEKRKPPFYAIAYAGYITASTRASLYRGAIKKQTHIVSFNTDGIYSLVPLNLNFGDNLGQWELKEYGGIVSVMAGMYFLYDPEKNIWELKTRGVDRPVNNSETQQLLNNCRTLFREATYDDDRYTISFDTNVRRFVGLRYSLVTDERWKLWRTWTDHTKKISIGRLIGTKRKVLHRGCNPFQEGLAYSIPNNNYDMITRGKFAMSRPYERPWDYLGHEETDDELEPIGV